MIYSNDFWWFVPIALIGLPIILANFIGFSSLIARYSKDSRFFALIFAISWILFEYIRSFIFTGFPWNLAGYSLSFSYIPIQIISKIGIYGLSFCIIYIFSGFVFYFINKKNEFKQHIIISFILISVIIIFGIYRVNKYPTEFTNHKIRIIQASIKQEDKWSREKLIDNLNKHMILSETDNGFTPEIILWSESAIPFPINRFEVREHIAKSLKTNQILVTGAILENDQCHDVDTCKIFVSFAGIDKEGKMIFSYEKKHLVPFGEYIPFKHLLPVKIKKITNGFTDFSPGQKNNIISWNNLKIRPLICYESIFPDEIFATNQNSDVLINITNDAWYGNVGPYQHLDISRMRSVETGLPMIRAANNGISAIIDPIGRMVKQTSLNEIGILDGYIPKKLQNSVPGSNQKKFNLLLLIILIFVRILTKSKIVLK
jgi:apolipoprotein N-acyltransferase